METARRFYQLLEDLDSAGQPYVRQELLNELVKVKKLINKLAVLEKVEAEADTLAKFSENPKKNAPTLMKELVKGFKDTQNLMSILHLFALNHQIDDLNVMKFLEMYFQALFKTTLFSIVCLKPGEKAKYSKSLTQINKQFLTDSAKEIILQEIEEQFSLSSSSWARIDLSATKLLQTFFLNNKRTSLVENQAVEKPMEDVFVIKLKMASEEELLIITDCPDKTILLEKYLEFDLEDKFTNIFEVVKEVLQVAYSETPESTTNEAIVKLIEAVKIEYVDLARKIFIKFLQQDLVSYFNAECKLILEDSSPEIPKNQRENSITKKRIEIRIVSSTSIEITNNFLVEMRAFSAEISEIWAKLNQKYLKVEQQAFENARRSFESNNSQSVCLDFNSNLYLVYQNVPLPESLKKYVNIGNFLYVPTTRSHLVVIGSNLELLTKISESLQEAEKSKKPISLFERNFKDLRYQLVVKIRQLKPESKKTRLIDSFSLTFYLGESSPDLYPLDNKEEIGLDQVLIKKRPSMIRSSVKKVMTVNKFKKLSQKPTDDILSEQNIGLLRNSIISEYLPDQEPGLERQVTSSK